MKLLLKRIAKKPNYTIGKLYIDNKYVCDTLEDTDRGLTSKMELVQILSIKIKTKTAIPTGTYFVSITYSPRFKKNLPLINNVKGFEGIRIHSGNTAEDTLGCILLGQNKEVGKVLNSRETCNKVFPIILNALNNKLSVTIEIV